jgi:hypothetical protein
VTVAGVTAPPEPDGGDDPELDRLIDRADLEALLRLVDARSAGQDWAGLVRIRERARFATRTGRQLWPASALAEYRLALRAPAEVAALVLTEDAGHFSLGPLTEVAAQEHTWSELAPHLDLSAPRTAFVAHERVLRGEDLRTAAVDPRVLDLPLVLQPWEPDYPLAEWHDDGATFTSPPPPAPLADLPLPASAGRRDDLDVTHALRELVAPWTSSSNGRIEIVAVEGDHAAAIAAIGVPAARAVSLAAGEALAWLGWAGASGGAHGRRRGAATGRFNAWWAVAALGGLADDWPIEADEVGAIAAELQWFWWDAHEPVTGWQLNLAVWDEADGLAWAITARDDA